MRMRDVQKLAVGDYIRLKHKLGSGYITRVVFNQEDDAKAPQHGKYPMIQFKDEITESLTWCTYLAIDSHTPKTRIEA